jgi:hypothetical protein
MATRTSADGYQGTERRISTPRAGCAAAADNNHHRHIGRHCIGRVSQHTTASSTTTMIISMAPTPTATHHQHLNIPTT